MEKAANKGGFSVIHMANDNDLELFGRRHEYATGGLNFNLAIEDKIGRTSQVDLFE